MLGVRVNKSIRNFLLVSAAETVLCVVTVLALVVFFLSTGLPLERKLTPFFVGGAILALGKSVYCAASAKVLSASLVGVNGTKEKFRALSDFPLRGLVAFLTMDTVFAVSEVVYFASQATFLNTGAFALSSFLFAICMVYSGLAYICLDRIVFGSVLSNKLTTYGDFSLQKKQAQEAIDQVMKSPRFQDRMRQFLTDVIGAVR